ncbi:AbrB family transcriptional regulator [Bacillaceae bacterium S4-13-56]
MHVKTLIASYLIAIIGGVIFNWIQFPIPWILGPITSMLIYKVMLKKNTYSSPRLKNISLAILGIQIGQTFTPDTLHTVQPYFIPYMIFSILMIIIAILNGYWITKWVSIDPVTSILGTIPGGLSTSIALSDSLKGNTIMVTIFHTIRLLAVLFIIPFAVLHWFNSPEGNVISDLSKHQVHETPWILILYFTSICLGFLLQKKVPASFIVIPMILTAISQITNLGTFSFPSEVFLFAQLTLGVFLGNSVEIRDLLKAGKYCGIYLGLNLFLIVITIIFAWLFSLWTGIPMAVAVLSIAPGGLVEMALTAQSVGLNPSIVSSLQIIRLLIVVLIIPIALQVTFKMIKKKEPVHQKEDQPHD